MMNPEKGPENVNPDNSDFETKEVANVFNENTTNEFAPLPQDPSEILKDVREFLKPINERLKQLKKEFKVLRGLFQSAYQNSKPTEKLASELESNKKETEKLEQEREAIEEGAKTKIKSNVAKK